MTDSDIKVVVVAYPDRKNLMLRYTDPLTGKQSAKSAKTTNRREAERAAAKWEAELQAGRYQKPSKISWEEFRERYEDEKLASLSQNTLEATSSAFNHLEEIINPQRLAALDAQQLSRFQAELRKSGIKETSIATHLRHIRAGLSWAVSMDLLPAAPKVIMPQRAKGKTLMRGRPITTEEFERLISKVPEVRPNDAGAWVHYLRGLWFSGLRLAESLVLAWEDDAPISVDFSGRRPRLRIYAEAEKGHQDRMLPMTPDFAEFLDATPKRARSGRVFCLLSSQTSEPLTAKAVCCIVSKIGKTAGVVVNKTDDKFASAHDLRRAFGTRWAARVKPATLQLLMRHKSIETTLKYYVSQDSDDVADELWSEHERRSAEAAKKAAKRPRKAPKKDQSAGKVTL